MTTDRLSIVIPCYWVNEDLWDMSDALFTYLDHNIAGQVVIVDDGSPNEYETSCGIPITVRPENGGYAAAVNTGLAETSGDVLIICNNDIEFIQPDWLDHLLEPLEDGYDISMIRTTDADGWTNEDKITEGDKFGSLWAMKRGVYETLGPLEEGFGKGYFEDLDYWRRAMDAGFKIAKNHNGLVEHKGNATFGTLDLGPIYNTAMVRYKDKHPDAVLFTQTTDGVTNLLLADGLDLDKLPESARRELLDNAISADEARKLWKLDAN